MKNVLFICIILHASLHFFWFLKAFNIISITPSKLRTSKTQGIFWLMAALLLMAAAELLFLDREYWWIYGSAALILSQTLLILNWKDAKAGTAINILFCLMVISGYGAWQFHSIYRHEVEAGLGKTITLHDSLLTDNDIKHLPFAVQTYIRYTGAIGQPRIQNFSCVFSGRIRQKAQNWMSFRSEQYNFMSSASRFFYMKASMLELPVNGFHSYKREKAFMDIRLLSLFKVQFQRGPEMDTAETVTFFNDMCCMAPGSLIDRRIQWTEPDSQKVKALFTNRNITVSATLLFNTKGELINFISDNRYASMKDGSMQKMRWSTPLKNYRWINGNRLASNAETVYTYPDGDFCYGQFNIRRIEYNCKDYQKKYHENK
jgi:hypothetical protein